MPKKISQLSAATSVALTTQVPVVQGGSAERATLSQVLGLGSWAPFAAKTAAYTLTGTDYAITADATGGAFSVTLPTAVSIAGRQYVVKRINAGANAVTVGTTSAQTIDGAATFSLAVQYQSLTVISDGTNWMIV